MTKTAKRHYCSASINATTFVGFHTKGNGVPRSKTCTYCRGALEIEEGYHCVFVWSGSGIYKSADAVKIFTSPTAAERYADAHAQDNLCVRWMYADQM